MILLEDQFVPVTVVKVLRLPVGVTAVAVVVYHGARLITESISMLAKSDGVVVFLKPEEVLGGKQPNLLNDPSWDEH